MQGLWDMPARWKKIEHSHSPEKASPGFCDCQDVKIWPLFTKSSLPINFGRYLSFSEYKLRPCSNMSLFQQIWHGWWSQDFYHFRIFTVATVLFESSKLVNEAPDVKTSWGNLRWKRVNCTGPQIEMLASHWPPCPATIYPLVISHWSRLATNLYHCTTRWHCLRVVQKFNVDKFMHQYTCTHSTLLQCWHR